MNSPAIAPTRKSKKRGTDLVFSLLFLFVDSVCSSYWVELLEFKLLVRMLLLVLAGVVRMAFANPLRAANRYEFYEFIL